MGVTAAPPTHALIDRAQAIQDAEKAIKRWRAVVDEAADMDDEPHAQDARRELRAAIGRFREATEAFEELTRQLDAAPPGELPSVDIYQRALELLK